MKNIYQLALVATVLGVSSHCNADLSLDHFPGVWVQEGNGLALHIKNDTVFSYHYTRETCSIASEETIMEASQYLTELKATQDQQGFSAVAPGNTEYYRRFFTHRPDLPASCNVVPDNELFNPIFIFNHVWHSFNDYYPFFKERNVNWNMQYTNFRSTVSNNMSEQELFAVLSEMISPLDDIHVSLEYIKDGLELEYDPVQLTGYKRYAAVVLNDENASEDEKDINYFNIINQFSLGLEQQFATTPFQHFKYNNIANLMSWGILQGNIGYLQINSMVLYAGDDGNTEQELETVNRLMDKIMSDLNETDSIIIDTRFNGGGHGPVALAIANHFADTKRLAYSSQAYNYGNSPKKREFFIEPPTGEAYSKPVHLITGPDTVSAAELFVIAMDALPHVTQYGESTQGAFSGGISIQLDKHWGIDLSSEIVRDHKNQVYEAKGIAPNHSSSTSSYYSNRYFSGYFTIRTLLNNAGVFDTLTDEEFRHDASDILKKANIPGLSTAWISENKILGHAELGYADVEQHRKVNENTPFNLGSISKTVIGVAVAQAIESDQLSLDDKVSSLNPTQRIDNPGIDQKLLTLRHLVTHTSGIKDSNRYLCGYYLEKDLSSLVNDFGEFACPEPVKTKQKEFLSSYLSASGNLYHENDNFTKQRPGVKREYSNIGAALAADSLAYATGIDFKTLTESNIFIPLKMHKTHWFTSDYAENQELPATRYALFTDEIVRLPEYQLSTWSDGALKSTALNLARFLLAIVNEGELDGNRILEPVSVENMLLAQSEHFTESGNQGILWHNDGVVIGHSGGDFGTLAQMRFENYNNLGFVLMLNASDESDDNSPPQERMDIAEAFMALSTLVYRRGLTLRQEVK